MDLDVTFLIQSFVVLTIVVGVGNTISRPTSMLSPAAREKSIDGARLEGQKLLADTHAKESELQMQPENARLRRWRFYRQKLIDEIRNAERQLVDEARADAQKEDQLALKPAARPRRKKAHTSGKDLARQIALKLLTRDVQ